MLQRKKERTYPPDDSHKAGELLAIGSGNPISEELYIGNQHKAFQDRLPAILRSAAEAGSITVTAQMERLPAATLDLEAREVVFRKRDLKLLIWLSFIKEYRRKAVFF